MRVINRRKCYQSALRVQGHYGRRVIVRRHTALSVKTPGNAARRGAFRDLSRKSALSVSAPHGPNFLLWRVWRRSGPPESRGVENNRFYDALRCGHGRFSIDAVTEDNRL